MLAEDRAATAQQIRHLRLRGYKGDTSGLTIRRASELIDSQPPPPDFSTLNLTGVFAALGYSVKPELTVNSGFRALGKTNILLSAEQMLSSGKKRGATFGQHSSVRTTTAPTASLQM